VIEKQDFASVDTRVPAFSTPFFVFHGKLQSHKNQTFLVSHRRGARCISKMKRARATSVPRLLSLVALVSLVLSLVLLDTFSRSSRRILF
jgi:hypothetical protein